MNKNTMKPVFVIALVIAIAVVAVGGVLAAAGTVVTDDGLRLLPGNSCGDLQMDEFYACKFGGWQPTAAPEEAAVVNECTASDLAEYYACRASSWRPTEEAPVVAK